MQILKYILISLELYVNFIILELNIYLILNDRTYIAFNKNSNIPKYILIQISLFIYFKNYILMRIIYSKEYFNLLNINL